MGLLDTRTQVNYLPNDSVSYSVTGYGTIGVALAGTFSAGTIKFQGSNDGNTWTDLTVYVRRTPLANNAMVATGNYVSSVVSYQLARLLLTGFTGQLTVTASISTQII